MMSENIAFKLRKRLYRSILTKHIGWHDDKENATSVLTTVLSKDIKIINGSGSEGLASYTEGTSSLLIALCIGFFFAWELSLIGIFLTPVLIFSLATGIQESSTELSKSHSQLINQASVFAGDTIINYRKVASFGNSDYVVD